ncbi:PAS domain S-box protein [Halogeometricum sp. S1BR25-6]|uniref:histidine kinase n=1 Tax=Halogeometricum salsisoli TaxID=2950536 RepID=A0ABU2GBA4_9EURY|nr:PAS domain S-box protein [Halogeometricum sp. S1BR25-6]MDS0297474.1 PAS domain S-box protein [Halogeometricum sp. S1BR25-6]
MTRGADGISILCVDDDPHSAERTASSLERADDRFSVTVATDVPEGLDALTGGAFDCVVSAHDESGTDGLAFLEAVRDDRPSLPFVLFTADGDEDVASEAISAGVTDYVRMDGADSYRTLADGIRDAVDSHRENGGEAIPHAQAEAILDSSPDAILVTVDGRIVFANSAAVELHEADDATDLLGRSAEELVPPDSRATAERDISRIRSGDERMTRARRTRQTLDGETLAVEVTARAITWDGADGIVSVVRDVSERETREDERTRYAAAFAGAMDAIVVADNDGTYVDANRSACDLFGVPREELLGMRIDDFADESYETDDAWSEFLSAGEERGIFSLRRPDGERRIVEYAATRDVVPGEHLSVLRDVTDRVRLMQRRQAEHDALERMYRVTADREAAFEEKVRRLLELGTEYLDVPYGFLTRIEDGTQTIVHAVGDHESLSPGESAPLSRAYCRKVVGDEGLVAVRDAEAEGWGEDPAYEAFDLGCYIGARVVTADDLYGTFCFAGTDPRSEPFSDGEQAIVELMARWVAYELERREHTRELRSQTDRLDEFASMVSHDLRNPLSVANGYLELVREDGDPEKFDRIETALDRMDRIVGDLLYLARENEQIRELEPVDLAGAVRRAWETVDGADGEATLAVDGDLGVVTADPNRLAQLLENVFRNSLEHVGPAVGVRVVPTDDGFAIEDDGPGIPPERREQVFEQGFTTHREGTGFGLAIVKQIADGHGWTVSVAESEAGGARFELGDVR